MRTKHTPTPRTVQRPTGSHLALSGKPSAPLSTLKQGHSMGCRLDGINVIHVQPVPPGGRNDACSCLSAWCRHHGLLLHLYRLLPLLLSHFLPRLTSPSARATVVSTSRPADTTHTHTHHHGIVLADSRVKILGVCSSPISLSRGVGPCVQPNTHPIPRVSETLVLSLAAASAAQEQTHVKHQVHSYLL